MLYFRDHVVVLHPLQQKPQPHHPQAMVVETLHGKVIIIAMMETTMQTANGMVVIVVVMM